ncbi:MAG TPA: amidohydrolase [Firmicutes bacterium]|nr:amidohydrolase [Candidatus Fermentithermobacillaceae bacterium]
MSGNVLLKDARIIRKDGSIEGPSDILVESGVIRAVVKAGAGVQVNPEAETIDCSGCFASPGLVNLHTHSPMTVFRGIAEDVSIEDWFNAKIWPYESRLTPADVRVGAMLAIYEMLDSGVTAFFDHYFFSREIVRAAEDAGIRADIAPTIFGAAPNWKDALRESVRLAEEVNGKNGRVRVRIGPHAPYTCPPDVLKTCVEEARNLGVGIHIHVSETAKQVEDSLKLYGKTPFKVLYDVGAMEVPCVFAHGIWITEDDLSLLNDRCFFAVAPKTYLKLAAGFGNLYRFMSKPASVRSIHVGAGTDGAASSNTLNPLEQARLFSLLGKHHMGDATCFDLNTTWGILMKGHEALGQDTGDVAPGFAADIVIWDLNQGNTVPVYDPLAAIIYSADGRNVRDVLVGGEFRKRGGKVIAIDLDEVMRDVELVKERLLREGGGQAVVRY